MSEDDALGQELRDLTEEVANLRTETVRENALRAKRIETAEEAIKGQRKVTRRSLFIAGFAVVVAALAIWGVVIGHNALEDSKTRTEDARLGACTQQRVSADIAIAASHSHDVVLADNLAPKPRTSAIDTAVQKYLDAAHASDVIEYRKRLCTPQGIADFYSGHGGYEPLPKG